MKKPWLRLTALAFAVWISGFAACNNSGGMAGSQGGMAGCGGEDPAAKCNEDPKKRWDGHNCVAR